MVSKWQKYEGKNKFAIYKEPKGMSSEASEGSFTRKTPQ